MARWIQIPLCTEVGLGRGDIVLDGGPRDPDPLKRGTATNFRPMPIVAKQLDGSRCHFVWRSRLRLHIVLHGDPQQRGHTPNFRTISIVAKRLDASGYHLVRR